MGKIQKTGLAILEKADINVEGKRQKTERH